VGRSAARPRTVARDVSRGEAAADTGDMLRTRTTALLAVTAGVCLEIGVHALSGRREAWDAPQYWTIGLPVVLVVSLLIGVFSTRRDWLWTIAIVPSQVLAMMVRTREAGSLFPLAVLLAGFLSAPFVLAAFVGSKCRPARRR
jgi:hypothetical protein